MAAAAALSFELCQRMWDVFRFFDPDGVKKRGFLWTDDHAEKEIAYSQSKTGKSMTVPLSKMIDGERILLFPTLEQELRLMPRTGLVIVVDETSGHPLTFEQMNKRHRKICHEASPPKK